MNLNRKIIGALALLMLVILASCGKAPAMEPDGGKSGGPAAEAEKKDTDPVPVKNESSGTEEEEQEERGDSSSQVLFTSDISAGGLIKIYEKLGWEPSGRCAVKISTGEPPESNYLRPELIGDLVRRGDLQ